MALDLGSKPAPESRWVRLDGLLSELGIHPDLAAPRPRAARIDRPAERGSADTVLLQALERKGFVLRSQEGVALSPPHQAGIALGFDLGGTKLRGAAADIAGGLLGEIEEPTAHDRDNAAIEQIGRMMHRLLDRCGLGASAVRSCVVGVPGAVAPSGLVSLSPNLRIPSDASLATLLGRRLGLAVVVENDVNLAAFGEGWRGHGFGIGSLAFLSFGTGVGAGLVLDGRLVRGAFGSAGEVAFLPVGADPHADAPSSVNGVYEDLVSSAAIRVRHGTSGSVRDIFEAAEAGDDRAGTSVDRLAHDAALAVATLGSVIDPAVIVLGGGIGARPGFAERVAPLARALAPFQAEIRGSGLGPRAGVVGALMLAIDHMRRHCLMADANPQIAGVAA